MSWVKFIKRIQKEYELENDDFVPHFSYKDMLNFKFNLDSKFDNICFKNTDQNIIHITFSDINEKRVIYDYKVDQKEFKNTDMLYGVFSALREKINAPLRNRK